MHSHAQVFSKEEITSLIQQFPSNYEDMHSKKESWPTLKENLPHAISVIESLQNQANDNSLQLLADLAHNIGVFYTHVVADYTQAIRFLKLATESKKKIPFLDEQSLALSHAQLADCAYRNGNYIFAIEQFNLAHDTFKKKAGDRNCDLMRAFVLHASGNAFYNLGAYIKATEVFLAAKKIRELYLAEDDIEFGYLEHDWADVLTELGRYEEAEKLYLSSLDKKKKFFQTEDHTNIALLYQCQAVMYIKKQQFLEAETNLEKAQNIYEKHSLQFSSIHQVDLFRNYFYSINLRLAKGEWSDAENEIESLSLKLNAVYREEENPYLYRISHEKVETYYHQNKPNLSFGVLKESLEKFLPELKFVLAKQFPDDKKLDVAHLMSRYGIELFIKNDYHEFDVCLTVITLALELKESFYNVLQDKTDDPTIGSLDYAFSFYDLGILYYLDGVTCAHQNRKHEQIENAIIYFNKAKENYLTSGLHAAHHHVFMCEERIQKIKDTSLNVDKQLLRFSIFVNNPKKENVHNKTEVISYPNTIIRNYP